MSRIKVIDSPLGSGKTSWAIQYINQLPANVSVFFITPYLKEVQRIITSCPEKNFVAPIPLNGKRTKLMHLTDLVKGGENIASTHALFQRIDDELLEALRAKNYTLILDEVMNVVDKFDLHRDRRKSSEEAHDTMTAHDIQELVKKEYIHINNENYQVQWLDRNAKLHKYSLLKHLAERKLLYLVNDSQLLWTFPIEVFKEGVFSEIFILTYQFDYQFQAHYYRYFKLQYTLYHVVGTVGHYSIQKTVDSSFDHEWKNSIKSRINISHHSKNNSIGDDDFSLSASWYKKYPESLKQLKKKTRNFFQHITESQGKERMWTCFKDYMGKIKDGKIAKKNFLELNARATNDWVSKTTLAYLVNRYPDPFFQHFFIKRGVSIDERGFALSEMLQWIFRSAIRSNGQIEIYIPSRRMRDLLTKWLNNESLR